MNEPQRILIVGAGAVGQVYGLCLARVARVSFFVREQYADEVRRGFTFYALNHKRERARLEVDDVLTSIEAVAARTWDQVYVCLSSAAIRAPAIGDLLKACGDATIVHLQPGASDRAAMLAHVPEERLVTSMITLIAYASPLEGSNEVVPEPGMAYWFPPLSPAPCSGARAKAVVATLRAGRLPSKVTKDVPREVAHASAFFMVLLTALEASGWSFRALKPLLPEVEAAAREAQAPFGPAPLGMRLARRPFVLRLALGCAPRFVPFDFETYFRVHFTKVRDQTRLLMSELIAGARAAGRSEAIERLAARV